MGDPDHMAGRVNGKIGARQNVRFRQQFQHLRFAGMNDGPLSRPDASARAACQQAESHYVGAKRDRFIDVIDPHAHVMDIDAFHFRSYPIFLQVKMFYKKKTFCSFLLSFSVMGCTLRQGHAD
jgi:hypothetical protein